jgi:hypothetical protein
MEIEIEVVKEYRCCWKVGMRRKVSADFAHVLIENGFAKMISEPPRHKMVERPEKEK